MLSFALVVFMGLCSISGTLGMDASGLTSNMHGVPEPPY